MQYASCIAAFYEVHKMFSANFPVCLAVTAGCRMLLRWNRAGAWIDSSQ